MLIFFISNMSEPKYTLRSRKHLSLTTPRYTRRERLQFPAYGFSPDPRPLSAPVGDNTPRDYSTHDFSEMKWLLEEEKERNKVLEETSNSSKWEKNWRHFACATRYWKSALLRILQRKPRSKICVPTLLWLPESRTVSLSAKWQQQRGKWGWRED